MWEARDYGPYGTHGPCALWCGVLVWRASRAKVPHEAAQIVHLAVPGLKVRHVPPLGQRVGFATRGNDARLRRRRHRVGAVVAAHVGAVAREAPQVGGGAGEAEALRILRLLGLGLG